MKFETKTIVEVEFESLECCALTQILNGFIDLKINDAGFFDTYSLGERELEKIKAISKKLNSISTIID